eukprot:CAMPEP_0201475836 /NCGR_PEP_ID=MMETSP0151_2-20130828/1188_1 /ASSEMBLY_ACC=CAM_ASM_000257 /TAXON_ID=200890 /ORGANISM="Paramoeba atlantica, Strain 621/1 / CCAP 1560/9" /LENGTH=162 /DNA_ID=CAMNT_0047856043 /DNA_START=54 /DNA_END=542 /DNA_ORIENTATION=-
MDHHLSISILFLFFFVGGVFLESPEEEAFLAKKKAAKGVVILPSGLMYQILREGESGGLSPLPSTKCEVHYRGTLIDGTEFDSSYSRGKPAVFAPNKVIKGWTEALQLMREGDKWELYIPSELAYGNRAVGQHIKAGSALVFEIELIKVKGKGILRGKQDEL